METEQHATQPGDENRPVGPDHAEETPAETGKPVVGRTMTLYEHVEAAMKDTFPF